MKHHLLKFRTLLLALAATTTGLAYGQQQQPPPDTIPQKIVLNAKYLEEVYPGAIPFDFGRNVLRYLDSLNGGYSYRRKGIVLSDSVQINQVLSRFNLTDDSLKKIYKNHVLAIIPFSASGDSKYEESYVYYPATQTFEGSVTVTSYKWKDGSMLSGPLDSSIAVKLIKREYHFQNCITRQISKTKYHE
jgi:hypothetical protein